MKPQVFEFNFPLNDRDIVNLLKGTEYQQIINLGDGAQGRVKVFSSDRVKHISWEDWSLIARAAWSNPELMHVIKKIENEGR